MIAGWEVFIPDGDDARRWAEEELADPRYADARPTWFDLLARDVAHFLADLFSPQGNANAGPIGLIIVCIVVVAVLVAALLVWGRPRAARSVRRGGADLLGGADDRTAAQLRADADRSARGEDWEAAVVLRFRAIARGLIERDLLDPAPGATAQAIAREAGAVFADERAALTASAAQFDDVRYLEHPADAEGYRRLVALDERLTARRIEAVPA
ncbi:DUF4129 domain-containing protein [Microbacterium sp. NPDC055903]